MRWSRRTWARAADPVQRRFSPAVPNVLEITDFAYVATWWGQVYVAFVIDAYARHIPRLAHQYEHDHHPGAGRAP